MKPYPNYPKDVLDKLRISEKHTVSSWHVVSRGGDWFDVLWYRARESESEAPNRLCRVVTNEKKVIRLFPRSTAVITAVCAGALCGFPWYLWHRDKSRHRRSIRSLQETGARDRKSARAEGYRYGQKELWESLTGGYDVKGQIWLFCSALQETEEAKKDTAKQKQ